MKVAVVGAGVAGLVAARTLAVAGVGVVLYEKENKVGGHARTVHHKGIDLDAGFTVFNPVTYPDPLIEYFEKVGLEMKTSSMSLSVSLNTLGSKGCEWSSNNLGGLFAQKQNIVNPFFYQMIRELVRFKDDVFRYLEKLQEKDCAAIQEYETLGEFLNSHKYSQKFRECYLIPTCASVWPYPSEIILGFSAASILTFYWNNHLLQMFGDSQCLTVKDHSKTFVSMMVADLEAAPGSHILIKSAVTQISITSEGVQVKDENGGIEIFDKCTVSTCAPKALQMLGEEDATSEERCILSAFKYSTSNAYLHQDVEELMPKNKTAWAAHNFLVDSTGHVYMTYWLNHLQNLGSTGLPYLVTMNPPKEPKHIVEKWHTSHLVPSPAAATAAKQLERIQGKHGIWFCGAYQGHGFYENSIKAGLEAANGLLGTKFKSLAVVKQMVPTSIEFLSRSIVTGFLRNFIHTGRIQLLEAGGTVFDFSGDENGCNLQCKLHIIRPIFYWKIAIRHHLGFGDAYVDGDFTCDDEKNGLLNFFLIFIANRDIDRLSEDQWAKNRKDWMVPLLWSSSICRTISYFRYLLHNNSLTNAPHNIVEHYNKDPQEPLVDAQMHKINLLIDKAQVESTHEVLEMGCGWGGLAIQLVRRTGCHYTGITLSEEQLKFAKDRVKEAHLEDKITFLLCDYRLMQGKHKYNRIISCEMVEHLGHEYLAEWFKQCDHLLAKDGILVVQVTSMPDEMYKEHRTSSEFVKENVFPGTSLPGFGALITAMNIGSCFSVESMENHGSHYVKTLQHWHDNFHANRSKILQLGFSEKFFRMWDYYFIYSISGFKSCTLGNLQIVFSRPGNTQCFGDRK